MDLIIVNVICDRCSCKDECDYYEKSIKPVRVAIVGSENNDAYAVKLGNALDEFECEYFEE